MSRSSPPTELLSASTTQPQANTPLSPASEVSQGLSKHVIANQKEVVWPDILKRLRQAFSLDPQVVTGEEDIVALQAVSKVRIQAKIRN